jgi:hypothetical protein
VLGIAGVFGNSAPTSTLATSREPTPCRTAPSSAPSGSTLVTDHTVAADLISEQLGENKIRCGTIEYVTPFQRSCSHLPFERRQDILNMSMAQVPARQHGDRHGRDRSDQDRAAPKIAWTAGWDTF